MKIPQHILEAINCGEVSASDYYEKYGRENIEHELQILKLSDSKFFHENPTFEEFKKNSTHSNKSEKNSRLWTIFINLGTCAAAVLFAFVMVNSLERNRKNYSPNREKGDQTEFFIYKKIDENVELMHKNDSAKEGDALQIAYKENEDCYGVIFSVDGNGNVTYHYPDDGLKSVKFSSSNAAKFLNYSYVLDDAPEYEIFFLATSENPFEIDESKLKGLSLKQLQEGHFFPRKTKFSAFLINKR